MKLSRSDADVFVPDGAPMPDALRRSTHLSIAAHQDDQEFMAFHGIAECFAGRVPGFAGVVVTDGAGSPRAGPYAGLGDAEMVRVRTLEQRRAAEAGRYACQIQLKHPSADVRQPGHAGVLGDLRAILEEVRPRVLYVHGPADKHDTHVAACLRTIEAIRLLPKEGRPERVLGCEVWRGLDWLTDSDKQILPIPAAALDLASTLCAIFESQIAGGKRYDLAVAGRRRANATFLESHAVDEADSAELAMDLTPLIRDDSLDVAEYARGLVRRLEQDIADRIRRCTTPGPTSSA